MSDNRNLRTRRSRTLRDDRSSESSEYSSKYKEDALGALRSPIRSHEDSSRKHCRRDRHGRIQRRQKMSSPYKREVPLDSIEHFPPLGSALTPDLSFKLTNETRTSRGWCEQMDELETRTRVERENLQRFRRKLDMNADKDRKRFEVEDDEVILARRQKTVDYGKNTIGYDRYSQTIPRAKRQKCHPKTPNKYWKVSRRSWDTQVKTWRKLLHIWDPPSTGGAHNSSTDAAITDCSSEGSLEASMERDLNLDSDNYSDSESTSSVSSVKRSKPSVSPVFMVPNSVVPQIKTNIPSNIKQSSPKKSENTDNELLKTFSIDDFEMDDPEEIDSWK
ncbi:uncharacterized protein LOC124116876 [Haliotis rufescens]|uniref:uncharacterized protein LOC124116876 n=1 Tax=Haliotis rufescens TaxID=6454 RepID=UPI001EB00D80|nr:uncharacterized protein LOC124116876 [Haliotis rufescens]